MSRVRLKNRRASITVKTVWHQGISRFAFHVTYGYDHDRVREIFIAGAKEGTMLRHILQDAAVIASIALQHGATLEELCRSLGREQDGSMASPLGVALSYAWEGE